ncbi:MAG: accessory factor UbiK family protein [Candidatus Pelagibacter sp. TMED263]|nr:MAG: accessory factor UbiK family protein [Candidatus Pelagibacter sp. TMED263]
MRYSVSDKEKILKTLSSLLEAGILTANDVKKELITNFKFKKDNIVSKLDLVSREEFEVLKKLVEKQDKKIKQMKKKTKKAKKS